MTSDNTSDQTVMTASGTHRAVPQGSAPPPQARLVCLEPQKAGCVGTGLSIELTGKPVVIGRKQDTTPPLPNVVPIAYEGLSRVHAELFSSGGHWLVKDRGSSNGTTINGSENIPPESPKILKSHDEVCFASLKFRYEEVGSDAVDRTVMQPKAAPKPKAPPPARKVAPPVTEEELQSDRTMMPFARDQNNQQDLKAIHLVMHHPKTADVPEPPEPQSAHRKAVEQASTRERVSQKTKSAVGTLLMILVLGGLGYLYSVYQSAQVIVDQEKKYQNELNEFLDAHESVRHTDSTASDDQRDQLRTLLARADLLIHDYPQNTEGFRERKAQVLFWLFERDLAAAFALGDIQKALRVRTDAGRAIGALALPEMENLQGGAAQSVCPEITGDAVGNEVVHLLRLADALIQIKDFALRFKNTGSTAVADRPSAIVLGDIQRSKDKLVQCQQNYDKQLSGHYAFFGRMAKDIDSNDIKIVDYWIRR